MEDWQRKVITANTNKLIRDTVCHDSLLTKLLASEILSNEDVQKLRELSKDSSSQALNFYNVLMTRKGAFKALIDGLQETKQSGALSILTNGIPSDKRNAPEDPNLVTYDKNVFLGMGSLGTLVYKGRFDGNDVAVKRLNSCILNGNDKRTLMREIEVLCTLKKHKNIVQYFGIKFSNNYVLIPIEICTMTLRDWVAHKTINLLPLEILRQVTIGLEWLHSEQIVHRDIKPENILLALSSDNPTVKISDFGLSYWCAIRPFRASTVSTLAPEILSQLVTSASSLNGFTFASDIFSLGCVYYYVLSDGKYAFGNTLTSTANILLGKHMMDRRLFVHASLDDLKIIELMISTETSKRPTCASLISNGALWNKYGEGSLNLSNETFTRTTNTLVCRLTMDEITVGVVNEVGEPKLLLNSLGNIDTTRIVAAMEENDPMTYFANVVLKNWTLRQHFINPGREIVQNGTRIKLTLEFVLGQFLKLVKPAAESESGVGFFRILIAVPLVLLLEKEKELKRAAMVHGGFLDVHILSISSCLAMALVLENENDLINKEEILILSQSALKVSDEYLVDLGLYKYRQYQQITKLCERKTIIYGFVYKVLRFMWTVTTFGMIGYIKPPSHALKVNLTGLFDFHKPRRVIIAWDYNAAYNTISSEIRRYNLITHTFPNQKLAVIKGAMGLQFRN